MYSVVREVVNGMNGIELNITESGVVRTFDCRYDAQAYLRELQAKADCNRFAIRGVTRNEFRAERKGESLHYFRFIIRVRRK